MRRIPPIVCYAQSCRESTGSYFRRRASVAGECCGGALRLGASVLLRRICHARSHLLANRYMQDIEVVGGCLWLEPDACRALFCLLKRLLLSVRVKRFTLSIVSGAVRGPGATDMGHPAR